jgi:N-acetylmuramic acid 6-phosphate etherase
MSKSSDQRSAEFLRISHQFKLGALVTESSHPVTARLSEVAQEDIAAALDLLFQVDADVVARYKDFAASGRAGRMAAAVLESLKLGGRLFFTGCGATGRLSILLVSIWRDFWQRRRASGRGQSPAAADWENRAFSVMAGGDFALIKSVEGFEDFVAFGRQQLEDLGVSNRDVVFAITEGGETSFVIGTAWKGVEAGARVYFVYNNPDSVLCEQVERSRRIIEEPRVEKLNLTTGPMAISGSTRMQATTIQLCVLLTVLEMVVRELVQAEDAGAPDSGAVPGRFLEQLAALHATLRSAPFRAQLARLVALEESVYCTGHRNTYFADQLGIDVLTDTTERSPTYCTPPFRKFDDPTAAESWSFLFVPEADTARAWERILKRRAQCVEWTAGRIRGLVGDDRVARCEEVVRHIGCAELLRFRIGLDGLPHRVLAGGDSAISVLREQERAELLSPGGFHRVQLEAAVRCGARTGWICFGDAAALAEVEAACRNPDGPGARLWTTPPSSLPVAVWVPVPRTDWLLDGLTRAAVKMVLNALSTCTMVRLGRVMGNTMIWVVASNGKLIDRATRYIRKLTGLDYAVANRLLFEVIEYVEPRMRVDRAYPPVVCLAVMRALAGPGGMTNEEAERRLLAGGREG